MNNETLNKTENILGTASIMPLVVKFAGPSILSMLALTLYNLTDQIFIGHVVGYLGNAAVTAAFPTVTFSTGVSMLIGIGMAACFSMKLGAKEYDEAKTYVMTGFSACMYMGILLFIFLFSCKGFVLRTCGATEDCWDLAMSYFSITCIGLPFHLFTHAAQAVIRADGSPRYSMLCTMAGVFLNIFLDWLFMYPMEMGMRGAAIATVIGQFVSLTMCLIYLPRFKAFRLSIKEFGRLSFKHVANCMKTGIPNFVSHMLMMISIITLNRVLVKYGAMSDYGSDIPLAVSGIAAKINMIMVSFSVGLAQGAQPIWGYNLGAKKIDRVKKTYQIVFVIAFVIGVIAFVFLQTMPRQIISIFGTGTELYFEFAEKYLKMYMLLVFFQNIQPLTINYFSAIGYAKEGLFVSITRQGAFLIPLLIVLPIFFGLQGILVASPIADTMAFIVSVAMVLVSFKKMERDVKL